MMRPEMETLKELEAKEEEIEQAGKGGNALARVITLHRGLAKGLVIISIGVSRQQRKAVFTL